MSILSNMLARWKAQRDRKNLPTAGVTHLGTSGPPIIQTPWGPVTESERLQAAVNMREDPQIKRGVEELLARQLFAGNLDKGIAEARKRYPEAYQARP